MQLYFVRHPQTQFNLEKIIQWWADSPLTQLGIDTAQKLWNFLRTQNIQKVFCSDLGRCRQTAQIICWGQITDIVYTDKLIERSFGDYNWKSKDYIKQQIDIYDVDLVAPNWENFLQMKSRVIDCIYDICKIDSDKVLIVAHEWTLRAFLSDFYDCYPNDEKCNTKQTCVYKVGFDNWKFHDLEVYSL